MRYLGGRKAFPKTKELIMARAAVATAPVAVKDTADHIGDALMALKNVDLRTIKNPELRENVKTSRILLTAARKGVK